MEEEFVDIKDYEGLYQINRLGVVKSLSRYDASGHLRVEKILKTIVNIDGYCYVPLTKNKKLKNFKIHCLLYKTFICDYDNRYFQIDHINRIRTDNRLENLVLGTIRDNHNNRTNQSLHGCGVIIKYNSKYQSFININNKKIHLGVFRTPQQAHSKYLEVKSQIEEIEKTTRSYSFTKIKINGEYFLNFFHI